MAISVTGKIVITVVVLGVLAGMSTLIYFLVTDAAEEVVPVPTTEPPGVEDSDMRYRVGVGIADTTGPCVEIAFMGYAEVFQTGRGIHLRQFSRAFIFESGDTRVVLVIADIQAVGIALRRQVVTNLQELYGDMYSLRNVIVTGTHTHSGPGGHLVEFLFDITIRGFSSETFDAYAEGITRSIVRAHENIVPANLYYAQANVSNVHMNRSPYSYEYNPEEEKARYDGNTDDTLTQVRIVREDGNLHGVLNWYAIHTTSMNMTNRLISSDNLGYAAITMEKMLNPGALPGKGGVVAGFFPSNLGDVSPNTRGARCEFSGNECDNHFTICDAGERCFSLGPGDDMFESTKIIGHAIYEGALEALNSPGEELTGGIAVVHQFVDMPTTTGTRYDPITQVFQSNQGVSGCMPAMGYSFASGTQDGANTLNITQGTITNIPILDAIAGVPGRPTEQDRACHAPKPILLMTGRSNTPLPWHPRIVSMSLVWLGDFAILGVPGEPTTMAGRRMRAVVGNIMEQRGYQPRIVVSGLTNEYIHYVATFEEYQVQRYEAASTIFGPHTLDIFLNKFAEFTRVAIEGGDVAAGETPADNRYRTVSLILPVVADMSPRGTAFGHVLHQPATSVARGDVVQAVFVGANPRNNLRQESSHAVVERMELGQWTVVATDADWETRFTWERLSTLLGTSQVTFEWQVPEDAILTEYRMVYYGTSRQPINRLSNFTGITNTFTIDAPALF
ncbi:unnamed protein product [Chilo suppressalis]|uniref:Neutral ceramidase n=1 Tax=Chilo suppressalis TaxID=168631 RepID=A0ABN8BHR4_CHISP|nr:unnamed protein product [Chilo suppressalis]